MRWIISTGTRLVLLVPVWLVGTGRCPSTSISVRCAPRPRRFARLCAVKMLPVLRWSWFGPLDGRNAGSWFITSSTDDGATCLIWSTERTVSGVGELIPGFWMRDPVMTTSSSRSPLASAVCAVATVGWSAASAARPAANLSVRTTDTFSWCIASPPLECRSEFEVRMFG